MKIQVYENFDLAWMSHPLLLSEQDMSMGKGSLFYKSLVGCGMTGWERVERYENFDDLFNVYSRYIRKACNK